MNGRIDAFLPRETKPQRDTARSAKEEQNCRWWVDHSVLCSDRNRSENMGVSQVGFWELLLGEVCSSSGGP